MKGLHLLAISAAMSALVIFAAAEADSQRRPVGSGQRSMPRIPRHHDFIIIEREVIRTVEREPDAKQAPAPPPAPAAPPEPRKPYVIGRTYSAIPSGCMKLIEDGASYYYCQGDWYRLVGRGNRAQYLAVRKP